MPDGLPMKVSRNQNSESKNYSFPEIFIATLFSSLVSLGKYVADPFGKLPEITYWLMGGLSSVTGKDARLLLPPCVLGLLV